MRTPVRFGACLVGPAGPALVGAALLAACTPPDPPPPRPLPVKAAAAAAATDDPQARHRDRQDGLQGGKLVFEETFERNELGADWVAKQPGEWSIEGGLLKATPVPNEDLRNRGLWLAKPLPKNVRIVFQARSLSVVGDTKCEVFATEPKHETGYSVIMGGWNNTINTIARRGEHETARVVQAEHVPVERGRTYTWTIVRSDAAVRWYVDGRFMIAYDDQDPVAGVWFGFNNWATDVRFDNLRVFEL
ncbi:MAG: hypothetical protein EXR79_04625 [Myxococcales bacterium]|nr:hypothetical protein [Myxococcales bacterium]